MGNLSIFEEAEARRKAKEVEAKKLREQQLANMPNNHRYNQNHHHWDGTHYRVAKSGAWIRMTMRVTEVRAARKAGG
jgi:predicted RNA-binding protein (virulence factor B family)